MGGDCATQQGTCRPKRSHCTRQTGGTCGYFGCAHSRNSKCVEGKCVCPHGLCSRNGRCEMPMEAEALYLNSTVAQSEFLVSAEVQREEDWEIAVNLMVAAFVASTVFAALVGSLVLTRRALKNRKSEIRMHDSILG